MRKIGQILLVGFALLLFTSCEDKEEANLYKAQACLDKATAATANACLGSISGQTSQRSYSLRCSASFLAEGIDESAIIDALRNIDGDQGGDPTSASIAALAMTDSTASANAVSNCAKSGSDSLTALANFANVATALKGALALGSDPTPAQVETAIDGWGAQTPAEKEAVANAIIASQASMCNSTNGLFKDTDACTDINQAIAANPSGGTALADALIANLDNQSN